MNDKPSVGKVEWLDLTVNDAENLKGFYQSVVGWEASPVSMGDYNDFNINLPGTEETVAGICHARGPNKNFPPQWMVYVRVEDVEKSAEECKKAGGNVIEGPRPMGSSNFCIIQDPAGAVMGLISNRE